MLEILFQDEHLVLINKPHGLLVHQSPIARDAEEFAIQLLRDQIGQKVYPAHRLDRKTSGILVFSKSKEVDQLMQMTFDRKEVKKKYHAIVRGYLDEKGTIDYALVREEDQKIQDAITHYRCIERSEIPLKNGKFETARYSLVEVEPETGRFHQIRKHFAHIFHPILGDRPHGCNKQNKLWKENFALEKMMLHACELQFKHPVTNELLLIRAPFSEEFMRVKNILGFT